MDLSTLTLTELRDALRRGETTSVAATQAMLDRIVAHDNVICSYLTITDEMALEQAAAADRRRAAGNDSPLLGVPVAVKDILCLAGAPTTAGSKILEGFIPPYSAHAVQRLVDAGAVILGKTNTDEFAMGSSTENSAYVTTRNPWDIDRVPGGSSGGSAAAVAAGLAFGALGTDTGGSVRQPASFCGLVGIRPTLGLVPRTGVIPLAWSYDAVGPLTRTVEDAALLLAVMAADPALILRDMPPGSLAGFRLGLIDDLVEIAEPYVAEGVAAATAALEAAGARVVSCRPELLQHTRAMHYVVQQAEAARVHAPWFASQQEHYAPQVRRRIEAGQRVSATDYLAAQQARRLFIDAVSRAMTGLDALLAPTVPMVAAPRTEAELTIRGRRLTVREALLQCTIPFTQLGSPVVTVPIGAHEGLPYGLQIAGRPSAERVVLRIAAACEQRWPWAARRPTPWRQ